MNIPGLNGSQVGFSSCPTEPCCENVTAKKQELETFATKVKAAIETCLCKAKETG